AVLLFEQQGGLPPAAQRSSCIGFSDSAGEVELAAVIGPPPLFDSVARQAFRDTIPVLAHRTDIAHGPQLADFLIDPVSACRLDRKGLTHVGDQESVARGVRLSRGALTMPVQQ